MDDERFRDLALAEILDGLTGEDREEYVDELRRLGPAGEETVGRLRDAVASVGLSVPLRAAPASLRERLLERVRETPGARLPEPEVVEDDPALQTRAPRATTAPDGGRLVLRPAGPGDKVVHHRPRPYLAAAASVAALALGATAWWLSMELNEARLAVRDAEVRQVTVDSLRLALDALQADLSTVSSPLAASVVLSAAASGQTGTARAFIDPATGRALVFVYELPVLPLDQIYQLWAIRGSTPVDAGTFRVGEDLRARVEVEDATLLLEADVLAVTVEPAPGRPAPTGTMVLAGQT